MKFFCFLFLFIFVCVDYCFSQDSSGYVFHLKQFPPEGILLNKRWKLQPGDNPDYAKPDYDDRNWQTCNPTLDIYDLPQVPKSGIVWFRLHLSCDSAIDNQLAMTIQQSGASEFYLNGKLIYSFGTLSNDPAKVKAFNPHEKPVPFPISNLRQQVLAVRYALQPNISYSTHFGNKNKALYIVINTFENAINQFKQTHIQIERKGGFWAGVFFILGILYLAFYLFLPTTNH